VSVAAAADPPGSPGANEALAVCERAGETSDPAEKRRLLAHGLELAEAAVAADERDAKAHFAVFCNLGKDMETRGIGVASVVALRRLRARSTARWSSPPTTRRARRQGLPPPRRAGGARW
jgi:hypothetical protein